MNRIKFLIYSIILGVTFPVLAQDQTDFNINVFPPSPEAGNLGVYAEIPVGYDTGVPNIDIPIWNISVGQAFKLPISLSYHASGIKTNQDASWVGLGWVLNAGGVISTTTIGQPDLQLRVTDNPEFANDLNFPLSNDLTERLSINEEDYIEKDLQPDIFHYNFNGFAGKFLLKEDGTPVLFPLKDLKIERFGLLEGWKIIDHAGIKYSFKELEVTANHLSNVYYFGMGASGISPPSESISAVYLSEIELPTKQKIYFNYQNQKYKVKHPDQVSKEYNLKSGNLKTHSVRESTSYINGKHLSSIVWDDGHIEFETEDRYDFLLWDTNPETPQRLSKIKIYNNSNSEPIKVFELDQDYFNPCTSCLQEEKAEMARLKLKGLKECDNQGNCKPPYTFLYDETNDLPSKQKGSRDHWGYMNSIYNSTNEPLFSKYGLTDLNNSNPAYFDDDVNYSNIFCPGTVEKTHRVNASNRTPSFPEMRLGSLLEIKYPTGGRTVFELEAHEFESNTLKHSVNFYDNINESISINGTTSVNYVTKSVLSERPVTLSFSMLIDPGNCYDYSCYSEPCMKSECSNLYGDNKIWVVDNNTGLRVIDVFYDEFEDIGDPPPFLFSVGSDYAQAEIALGISVTSQHDSLSLKELTLPPGNYTLHVQRDVDNLASVYASLQSYNVVEHDSNTDPLTLTAAGLRIKKKTDFDISNTKIKEFSYEYIKGVIYDEPSYYNINKVHYIPLRYLNHFPSDPSQFHCGIETLDYKGCFQGLNDKVILNSGFSNVLTTNHISYEETKVSEISNNDPIAGNGYSIYSFSKKTPFPVSNIVESWSLGDVSCENSTKNKFVGVNSGNKNKPYYNIYEGSADLKSVKTFSSDNELLRLELYDYERLSAFDLVNPSDYLVHGLKLYPIALDFGGNWQIKNEWKDCLFAPCTNAYEYLLLDFYGYSYHTGHKRLESKKTIDYFNGTPVEKEYTYSYSDNKSIYPSEEAETLNKGLIKKTVYKYPEDILSKPHMQDLIDENRTASPVIVETYQKNGGLNDVKLSEQEIIYEKDASTGHITLPKYIFSNKGADDIDSNITSEDLNITYNLYDANGNLLEYTLANGEPVLIIWGYNNQYPIAKIENATYTSFKPNTITIGQQALIDDAVTVSNNETTVATEDHLREKQQLLREGLPNAMVTTYTYDPLIGITSSTDPKGYTMYYHYDKFNRLQFVKDANGKVLSKNEYHFKE